MGNKIKVVMLTTRRALIVQPGLLRGSPGQVEVDVCLTCGSVAVDPILHDAWHRATDRENGSER